MEILLGILIIVVIAAIVAVLFIKKKQQALDTAPSASPLVRTVKKDESQTADLQAGNPIVDITLDNVSNLINTQRYDEATAELKKLFITNPKNSQVMLKLLQVYALTNNQVAFTQHFQKLKEYGDNKSIEEAELLRLAFDETPADVSFPEVAPTPTNIQTSEQILDGLDDFSFDNNDTIQQSNSPAKPANNSDLADFSDFNFDADESIQENTVEQTANSGTNADLDFGSDLNFNTPADAFDLDLGFDNTPNSTPAPQAQSDDGLSFDDFGLDAGLDAGLNTRLDTPTPSVAIDTDDSFGGLDFDSGLNFDTPAPTPVAETSKADSFDLDLGGLDTPTSTPTPIAEQADSFDFDLGGFEAPTPAPVVSQAVDNNFDLDNDFDGLDINTNTNLDINPLSFDTPKFDTPAATTKTATQDSLDTDFGFEFNETPKADNTANLNTADSFDFNLNSTPAPASVADDSGFDFNFEEKAVATPSPAQEDFGLDDFGLDNSAQTTSTNGSADISFDLDDFAAQPAPVVPQADNTTDFALDDFAIETPASVATNTNVADDEFGLGDFAIETPAPVQAEPVATNDFGADFGLDFATPTPAPTSLADELDALNTSSLEAPATISPSLDMASSLAKASISEPVAPAFQTNVAPSFDNIAGLELVNQLDNAQVTLDLAKNYLSLGEHGSAKRLLSEVIKVGTPDQQEQAYVLLNRLA